MKKALGVLIALTMIMLMAGCASKPSQISGIAAPDWAADLPPAGEFWGIGIAKLQNEGLARETATARARRDVAAQVNVLVQGFLEDYAKESGTLSNTTSIQSVERLGRELIDMNLTGATPNNQARMSDGTWWVRVSITKTDVQRQIDAILETEASLYADFKREEASKLLDSRLEQTRSMPTPVSND